MFGTAGKGAPRDGTTRSLVVCYVRTQASYSLPPPCPFGCIYLKLPQPVWGCAQDSRQGPWSHQGAGPVLTAATTVVMGTILGPGTRESSQDSGRHWERVVIVSLAVL
jgi:hypothetical protein